MIRFTNYHRSSVFFSLCLKQIQQGLHHCVRQKGVSNMHGPHVEWKKDNSAVIKELVGKWLFILYSIVYFGFILINVFSPHFMGIEIGSMNMAIIFGFGLILFAMLLAFAYNHISTRAEQIMNNDDDNVPCGGDDE